VINKKRNQKLTGGCSELEGPETNVVESLIVQNHTLISILYKLVNRERSIVRLHNGVRNLRRRKH